MLLVRGRKKRDLVVVARLAHRRANPREIPTVVTSAAVPSGTTAVMRSIWGRCKLHGGKSTGPRTMEGLERSRRANWKHGHFSREAKAERSRLRAAIPPSGSIAGGMAPRLFVASAVHYRALASVVCATDCEVFRCPAARAVRESLVLIDLYGSAHFGPGLAMIPTNCPDQTVELQESAP